MKIDFSRNRASRSAFTLIEILIVIVIIGLLAGMTTLVFRGARGTVDNAIVSSNLMQVSMALDQYKNKFGEYPPDFSDGNAVLRHVKKRWPRYNPSLPEFYAAINTIYPDWDLTAQEPGVASTGALAFWLGGLPDANGKLKGFYRNPKNPFAAGNQGQREEPFFDFQAGTVQLLNGVPTWTCKDKPVIYFRPSPNCPYEAKLPVPMFNADGEEDYARPYMRTFTMDGDGNTVYQWYEDNRFQLIHPGDDNRFGLNGETDMFRVTKMPEDASVDNGLTPEDNDNVTNFIENGTLETEITSE